MPAFGTLMSDTNHYYFEQYVNASLGIVVPQGGSGYATNLAYLYMPWQGDILVDGWANCYYDSGASILNMSAWPYANIGASNYFAGDRTETDANGGWLSVPFIGRWANLAKGTYFQLGLQFSSRAVNGRAVVNSWAGSVRAQAI